MEVLVSYLNFKPDKAVEGLKNDPHSSDKLKPIIAKHIDDLPSRGVNSVIDKMISERLDLYDNNAIEDFWQKAFVFIHEEQQRISIPKQTNIKADGNE